MEIESVPVPTVQYAGVWKRFKAGLIDALFTAPVSTLLFFIGLSNKYLAIFTTLISLAYLLFYEVYLVKKNGGTPGKLFCGIIITKTDGNNVDLKSALTRYSVYILLTAISSFVTVYGVFQLSDEQFTLGIWNKIEVLSKITPMEDLITKALNIWLLADALVLLFSDKNRAIHDFMAKTVVIHK